MSCILLCEDESVIREFVVIHLHRAGHEVIEAASGEEAQALYLENKDRIRVALLDVMLPGIDGFELCEYLRRQDASLGIMMLTARSQEHEKVRALRMGADDYVTKPFSPSELIARVEALLRRIDTSNSFYCEEIRSGDFSLNLRNRMLRQDGEVIELTQVEFQLMEFFMTHPGELLSRSEILERVWGEGHYGDDKIVDVNIRRLRMKVEQDPSEPQHILTAWGKGYQWIP